jgi:hypothetical protein
MDFHSICEAASVASAVFCETLLLMPVSWQRGGRTPTSDGLIRQYTSVRLHNAQIAMQVAFVADREARSALARALNGASSEDELGEQEVADGVGEVINIVAGRIKHLLNSTYSHLQLGLPSNGDDAAPWEPGPITSASEHFSLGVYSLELVVSAQELS